MQKNNKKNQKKGRAGQPSRQASVRAPPPVVLTRTKAPLNSEERRYIRAVIDPFDKQADGVRIPDEYGVPTVTRKFLANHVMGSKLANNSTVAAFSLIASPLVSFATKEIISNYNVISSGLSSFVGNPGVYQAVSRTTLGDAFTASRVVACGFKLRMEAPQLVRTGRIICVPVCYTDNVPSDIALNVVTMSTTSAAASSLFANQSSAAMSSNIMQLPGAFEFSMDELGEKDLMLRCKPSSPKFLDFATTAAASYNATYNQTGETLQSATTGAPDSALQSFNAATDLPMGHSGWLVYAYGLPTSTTADVPWFSIECVYHLEGTPIAVATNGAALTPTTVQTSTTGGKANFSDVLNQLRNIDVASVLRVAENVSNVFAKSSGRVTQGRLSIIDG